MARDDTPPAVHEAITKDRLWFRARPGARCKYRDPVEGELEDISNLGDYPASVVRVIEELAGILSSEEWQVRVVIAVIRIEGDHIISAPALEVCRGKVRRHVLLSVNDEGHFRELSVDEFAKTFREVRRDRGQGRPVNRDFCDDCGAYPETWAAAATIGRRIFCPTCARERVERGSHPDNFDICVITPSHVTELTEEGKAEALRFRRVLEAAYRLRQR